MSVRNAYTKGDAAYTAGMTALLYLTGTGVGCQLERRLFR
jgi:hypothetical protein